MRRHDDMKALNEIPEGRARENADRARGRLGRLLADGEAGRRGGRAFHEAVGQTSLNLALLLYTLGEEDDQVPALLRQAARHLAPALSLREPPEPGEHRSPWQGEQWIDVVACWGDADAIADVASLRPWQYRSPVRPEHDAVAVYLDALLRHLGGAPIDADALGSVVAACEAGRATKEDRLFLLPAAAGLLCVAAGDAAGWNLALAQILSAHAQEARRGDLRLLADGCLSLRALLLAKLGLDRGLALRARSAYMPVEFLKVEAAS